MDQELKAYLDEREARMSERFDQAQARMDERFTQMDERFAQMQAHMDGRFTQMDERFTQIDGRFAQMQAHMDGRFTQIDERFTQIDGRFTQIDGRFTQIDGRFTQIDGRFAQMQAHMDERFNQVETEGRHTRILVEGLHDNICLLAEAMVGTNERIDTLREETTGRLDEIKGTVVMIQQTLVPRVQNLENRAERQNLDAIEVIRERFGLRKTS